MRNKTGKENKWKTNNKGETHKGKTPWENKENGKEWEPKTNETKQRK